jgi:hypothetical protein
MEKSPGRIEVATGGLTFEEAEGLKTAYHSIRERVISKGAAPPRLSTAKAVAQSMKLFDIL